MKSGICVGPLFRLAFGPSQRFQTWCELFSNQPSTDDKSIWIKELLQKTKPTVVWRKWENESHRKCSFTTCSDIRHRSAYSMHLIAHWVCLFTRRLVFAVNWKESHKVLRLKSLSTEDQNKIKGHENAEKSSHEWVATAGSLGEGSSRQRPSRTPLQANVGEQQMATEMVCIVPEYSLLLRERDVEPSFWTDLLGGIVLRQSDTPVHWQGIQPNTSESTS